MSSLSLITRSSLMATLAGAALAAGAQTSPTPATSPADGTSTQRAAAEVAFVRADVDKDGKVSKEEAGRLPAIAAKFTEIDADKDGALSISEFTTGYTAKH